MAGRKDEALKKLLRLDELSKERYVSPFHRALIYMGLGENDQALEHLEKAYIEHEILLSFLNTWSVFDPIRSDPRFKILLKKMNLED